MRNRLLSLSALLALSFAGCSVLHKEPYRETACFDVAMPEAALAAPGAGATVVEATAAEPYGERMVFRAGPRRLAIDDFSRWAGPPAALVGEYLGLALAPPAGEAARYALSVRVLRLEAALGDRPAVTLALRVAAFRPGSEVPVLSRIYREELALAGPVTGEAFAMVAGEALGRIATAVAGDLQALPAAAQE